MEIRSYRRVFDLERRVYSVEELRLNPGGVPVRGVVYFLVLLSASLIAGGLPVIGALPRELPWYLRDLAFPGALATVLSVIRVEGRTFHLAAGALVRHRTRPRLLTGLERRATVGQRWCPQEIILLPDGSESRMRRLRYTGPGAVLVAVEHERVGGADEEGSTGSARSGSSVALTLRQRPGGRRLDRGQVILLAAGARMLVSGLRAGESDR
jgi:hypothetical protein